MQRGTLILTQRDVARLIDMRTTIRVVRSSLRAFARGQAVMPPKLYLGLPRGDDFRAMPAYLARPAACGMKWVNVHLRNRRLGLPTVMAIIVANDPVTGYPLAIMDGLLITKLRTAASAAVAASVLARPSSRVVGLVGCGAQADAQLLGLAEVLPVERVNVWGYRRGEASRFARRMAPRLRSVTLVSCHSVRRCVEDADVVVTLTPSRHPLIQRAWIKPGTHINAIGADAPGKQELDPKILRDGLVVVDDRRQAIHGGEINVPIRSGVFHRRQIYASLGELLVGRRPGRRHRRQITVFDSTGLAIYDVALAAQIVRLAERRPSGPSGVPGSAGARPRQRRIGRRITLFGV